MALPPEPTSDTPSASEPDAVHVDDTELTGQVDSLLWDVDGWSTTRSDDVELFSILATDSGSDWQQRVREAQQRGETLPLKDQRPPEGGSR
jgi:hypothetical protein